MLIDAAVPDEKNAWIGRSYADAPDVDGVVFVTGEGLSAGSLVPCEIVGYSDYDLVAAAVGEPRDRRVGWDEILVQVRVWRSTDGIVRHRWTDSMNTVWNVPNQLTVARLVLSIVCFVCLAFDSYLLALILFAIAAGTDWVDGFWARRYGQITQLGRILDPFADKIVICGTFIFLAAVPPTIAGQSASEITAWMAVVVVARELLVTALREHGRRAGDRFFGQVGRQMEDGLPMRWPPPRACGGCGTTASTSATCGQPRRPSGRPGRCGC